MTVLVGVLCQEGVILGSDSSATFAAGNLNTIEQSVQKTFVIGNDVILATTGAGGLGQRLQHILQTLRGAVSFDLASAQEGFGRMGPNPIPSNQESCVMVFTP